MKSLHIRPYHKSDEIKFVKVPSDDADKQKTIKEISGYGIPIEIDEIGVASVPPFQVETVDGWFPDEPVPLMSMKLSTYPTERLMYGATDSVTADDLNDYTFKQKVFAMISLMYLAKGVGLAAPQINFGKDLFVMDPEFNPDVEKKVTPKIIFNPNFQILEDQIGKEFPSHEGCLSVPGVSATMYRYDSIDMSYYDINFKPVIETFSGLAAVVAQHEEDHLIGRTIHTNLSKLDKIRYSDIAKQYKNADRKRK